MFFLMTLYDNVKSDTRDSGEIILFDFGTLENMADWLIVNDGVMGGLSRSRFILYSFQQMRACIQRTNTAGRWTYLTERYSGIGNLNIR